MPTFRAPARDFPELPSRTNDDLRRNFFELEKIISGISTGTATGWDAIIDPDLAADLPTQKRWKTVGAALTYYSGLGYTANQALRIGITGRRSTAVVTETVNFSAVMCPPGGVMLVGLVPNVRWKVPASHTIAGNASTQDTWVFKDLYIDASTIGASAIWFTGTAVNIIMDNTFFVGQQTANSAGTMTKIVQGGGANTQGFAARNCVFQYAVAQCAQIHTTECWWFFTSGTNTVTFGTGATASIFVMNGGGFGGGGFNTVNISADRIVMDGISSAVAAGPANFGWGYAPNFGISAPGGGISIVCQGGTTGTVFVVAGHGSRSTDQLASISTSAAKNQVTIIGQWDSVSMGGKAARCHIDVICNATLAVYGPATVRGQANAVQFIGTSTNVAAVQGEAIIADLVIQQTSGGAAGLTMTGMSYCHINVAGAPTGVRIAFNLNNTNWKNVINWSGYTLWTGASADAGTGNITPLVGPPPTSHAT